MAGGPTSASTGSPLGRRSFIPGTPRFVRFIALVCGPPPRPSGCSALAQLQVAFEVEGTVEDAEDEHLVAPEEIQDSVPAEDEHPDARVLPRLVDLTALGELTKLSSPADDPANDAESSVGAVLRDVVVDLSEPASSLVAPDQLRHDSMVFSISSCEMTLPASTSARPRSTMRFMRSSSRISS